MSQSTTAAATPRRVIDAKASRRSLVGGCVSNFIEWYEFGVYGYFATIIAANFFATEGASDLEALVKRTRRSPSPSSSAPWARGSSAASATASAAGRSLSRAARDGTGNCSHRRPAHPRGDRRGRAGSSHWSGSSRACRQEASSAAPCPS